MRFNLKVILLGGLAFYVTQFIVSMASGPFVHGNILHDAYRVTASFWRPELNREPPDMAALLPLWITTGLITSFVLAGIFDNIRSALGGSGLVKGMKFGFIAFLFSACLSAGWSGVFNLPYEIWVWWNIEGLVMYLAGVRLRQ